MLAERCALKAAAFTQAEDYPYDAIIRLAEQKGCGLIMMASHGRSGFKALLLGSETQLPVKKICKKISIIQSDIQDLLVNSSFNCRIQPA